MLHAVAALNGTAGVNTEERAQAGTELAAVLRSVRLFAQVPEEELLELARHAVAREISARGLLFRRGEPCRGLHVVLSGRLEVYTSSPDGREQVLHRIGAPQAETELPLFDGASYPASARAATPARVLFIPGDAVERLCLAHPEMLRTVVADLGRSIRRLTRLVEKVSLKDVRARVATALLEQAAAQGGPVEGRAFSLAWSQEQMANALGVTRESVARGLARLRREGVIEQSGRGVRILQLTEIAAIADGASGARVGGGDSPGWGRERLGPYRVALDGPCC